MPQIHTFITLVSLILTHYWWHLSHQFLAKFDTDYLRRTNLLERGCGGLCKVKPPDRNLVVNTLHRNTGKRNSSIPLNTSTQTDPHSKSLTGPLTSQGEGTLETHTSMTSPPSTRGVALCLCARLLQENEASAELINFSTP